MENNNSFIEIKKFLKNTAESQTNRSEINSEVANKNFIENLIGKIALKEEFKSVTALEVLKKLKTDFDEVIKNEQFYAFYEVVLQIFNLTNEKFRQQYFKESIEDYFEHLTESKIEQLKNVILPLVKLKLFNHNEEITKNLLNYLKNPLLHQEDVYYIIKKKLPKIDFDLIDYSFVEINEKFGRMSKYYHLKIKTLIDKKLKEDTFFVKLLFTDSLFLKEIADKGAGKKESFYYNTLYPLYEKNGLDDLLDFAPKCYLATNTGLIVLENLPYTTLKSDTFLNYEQLKLALIKIAKMHSCSIILEEILTKKHGKPYRIFNEYPENFEENLLVPQGELFAWFNGGLLAIKYFLKKLQKSTKSLEENLENIWRNTSTKLKKSNTIRNLVNHGDMYICNMMFNNELQDIILIDFQLLRYLPPAYEILFFIFLSTSIETRTKHLQNLLEHYYENLCINFEKFNLNPKKIFPKTDFDQNVFEAQPAAMAVASAYNILHMNSKLRSQILDAEESGKSLDEQRKRVIDLAWQEDEHFRIFGQGLVEDFIKLIENNK